MRKRTLGVVLVAGLAISGGSAFTGSNTVATSTAGYGAASVSGGEVTSISYVHDDATSTITSATFVATGDWNSTTTKSAGSIEFRDATKQLAAWDCTPAAVADLTSTTFSCVPGAGDVNPSIAAVTSTGITLTK